MKLTHIALLSAALVATAAHADDSFHRTLSAGSQPDVYVSTGSGNIRISPGSGDQIEITGQVHVGWGAHGDVHARVQQILNNPPIQQSGNSVRIGESNDRALFNNISIDYEIKLPANSALNLHSGSGDVEANDVGRFFSGTSGSGNVRAHRVHGPAELESGSGDLELDEASAGNIKARTGSGSIRLHNINGTLMARTGSGDIEADGRIDGASNVATGSGSVRLHVTPDSRFNLEAATGSGDIRVHTGGLSQTSTESNRHHLTMSVGGGGAPLEIRTGSGDITIDPK